MKLIALTGLPRAGKDAFADRLVSGHGYTRLQFSAPLKEAAAILLGRPVSQMRGEDGFDREAILPEWGFSTREFLQKFGTECLRNVIRQDFWVLRMMRSIQQAYPLPVVITDCRFENEAALVRDAGGTIIEIRRPGITRSAHTSDNGVEADNILMNDGTLEDLRKLADAFA